MYIIWYRNNFFFFFIVIGIILMDLNLYEPTTKQFL